MTFEDSIWLAITPLLALLSIALISLGWRKRSHLLGTFAAARLLSTLTEKTSVQRRLLKSALIVAAVIMLGLAMARPQYGVEWSERKARGLDIVFVLDSSRSMLATDLRPTRLERAKLAILDLIDRLESDRIGLVAFAGQAFLQTPPTLDYGAFRESLNATDPSILSRGGSDLGRAIEEAAKAFPSGDNVKVVVLLTDGEDLGGQALKSAENMAKEGIQIFAIGIGTPEGEYLRINNEQGIEEFVRGSNGQPVRSQLDESTLQQVAQLTGGSYTRLAAGSLNALYDSVLATLPREERASEVQEVRIERFQWLLALAVAFLVLEILIRNRRPGLTQSSAVLALLLLSSPSSTDAHPYNQAHSAMMEGNFAQANELYTQAMRQTNDHKLQRDALYNMGHATYQIGRSAYEQGDPQTALDEIKSAEKLFESALEIDPSDNAATEDLKRTREVRQAIEKLLEQQNEKEEQDQQDQQDKSDPSDSEDQDSQQSQEDQGQSGEKEQNQEEQEQEENGEQSQENQQDGSEQNQESQQEEGSESQPNEEQESSSDTQSGQEESSEEQSRSESETGEEESDEQSEQEQSQQTEASDEETGEQTPVPEVGEKGEESGTAPPGEAVQVEGMTLQEAEDLLDSLRGKEEILPFTKPIPGEGRPLQDW
ncbi:MAG: vWA domain-containing protein [Opitutales bacterium]